MSGSSFGNKFGRFPAKWFKMNWVLENLVQGASNGLEDLLLKFHAQVNYVNLWRIKEPSIYRKCSNGIYIYNFFLSNLDSIKFNIFFECNGSFMYV
jgi:hypothetical protein